VVTCEALEPRRLLSSITFSAASYPLGHSPIGVAIADLNNDGIPDLITANPATLSYGVPIPQHQTISVLLGNGDGTFKAATSVPTGEDNQSLAIGDFNGDGNTDIIAAGDNGFLGVLLGNGDGTFKPYSLAPDGLSGPVFIAAGDFAGDGNLDIAAVSQSGAFNILSGNGDGTFAAGQPIQLGGTASGIVAADFNNDGDLDLAVADSTNNAVDILLGNGNGTFAAAKSVSLAHDPTSIATGFLNGDGAPDIVTANTDNSVSVLLGNGDGTFQPAQSLSGAGASDVTLADINGDGIMDILALSSVDSGLIMSRGRGNGTFRPPQVIGNNPGPAVLAAADLNHDNLADIVLANHPGGSVTVLLNTSPAPTTPLPAPFLRTPVDGSTGKPVAPVFSWSPDGAKTYRLIVATNPNDLPANPSAKSGGASVVLDAATSASEFAPTTALGLNTVYYWEVIGKTPGRGGAWSAIASFKTNGETTLAAPTDKAEATLNGASNLPTISWTPVAGATQYRLIVATNPSDLPTDPAVTTGGASVVIDAVARGTEYTPATPLTSGTTYYFEVIATDGSQGGTWSTFGIYATPNLSFSTSYINGGSLPNLVATGDFNGDGIPDLVTAQFNTPYINILLGNGDGTFKPPQTYQIYSNVAKLVVADFNGDGKLDIAIDPLVGKGLTLLGNGDGTFKTMGGSVSEFPMDELAVGDVNGNGTLDAITSVQNESLGASISLQPGSANGNFSQVGSTILSDLSPSAALADFNHDGKADLAAAVVGGNGVSVLEGNGDGTFGPPNTYAIGYASHVAAGDLNSDGNDDIVAVGNYITPILTILLGNGDGTFAKGQAFNLAPLIHGEYNGPRSIILGDFNGDGREDIAVTTYNSIIVLLQNSASAGFQQPEAFSLERNATAIVSADLTGDGKPDFIAEYAAGNGVSQILMNTTTAPAPLLAPTPSSPLQGETNSSLTPSFSWSPVSGAKSYRLIVATDAAALPADPAADQGVSSVYNVTTNLTSFTPPTGLEPGTTYYWEVIGLHGGRDGTWSRISHFVAGPADLPAPDLYNPTNAHGNLVGTLVQTFDWSPVSGATRYRLILATTSTDLPTDPHATTGGPSVVLDITTSSTDYTPSALSPNTGYLWEVRAVAAGHGGVWSTIAYFGVPSAIGPQGNGYTPANIEQAYGLDQLNFNGAGQTVAIVDAYNDPNIKKDLRAFDAKYSIAAPPSFNVIDENGQPVIPASTAGPPSGQSQWISQTDLEVEWVHALAPGANILLVEAASALNADVSAAVATAADYPRVSVVAIGFAAAGYSTLGPSLFSTPAGHVPITFIAPSGDTGVYAVEDDSGANILTGSPAVDFPAGSASVLSVGGTTLQVLATTNGVFASDALWSGSSTEGGGYGVNGAISQPAYQAAAVSAAGRSVPDVSFDANPTASAAVFDLTDDPASPWTQVGGTNFGAAAWAAMIALTDQGRAAAGKIALSTDKTLRKLYALPASDFHNAGASPYDNGLGLGTPVANDLIPDLIGASAILSGGALSVTGTSGNDSISLSALSGTLTVGVNGSDSAFDNSRLTSIVVDALDGNDTVTVGRGIIGATLMGGNGNNSLVGGAGADSITGGVGSDTMIGGTGNDSLDGGAGNDLLEGDGGNDALTSNSGNSNAGGSNSTLIGGNGNDALTVGAGNNELFGDPGNDILYADSRMANTLYGGGGNDTATVDDLGLDQIPNGDIQTIIDGH
jgi:hypothetical protein